MAGDMEALQAGAALDATLDALLVKSWPSEAFAETQRAGFSSVDDFVYYEFPISNLLPSPPEIYPFWK